MRYIDSGSRAANHTLGHWMQEALQHRDVVEVRWQSGFFTADGMGFLAPTLDRIRLQEGRVTALVGSNNCETLRSDVERLLPLLGIPRPKARLGVVSFGGAFFHPKTYHFTRQDESQVAYVGSANLTSAGVGSLHVEAGVVLDTRTGDDPAVLNAIRAAVEGWFDNAHAGLTIIDNAKTLERLFREGVLAEAPQPRTTPVGGGNEATTRSRPTLRRLVVVPTWETGVRSASSTGKPRHQARAQEGATHEAFFITLQKTDVGVGQTTKGKARRSPEIFIPLVARDFDPKFWGWPHLFKKDKSWDGPTDKDGRGKMDRPGVMFRLGGETFPVHMWYNPDKRDLRLRSEHMRSAGAIGDILYVERSDGSSGFTYYVDVVPRASTRHTDLLAKCTNTVRNSKKVFGYL